MKKIFNFILYSFYALILAALVVLFFAPPVPGLGEFEVKIVKSGSMEPAIMTGAVVVVQAAPVYGVGDVITFSSRDSDVPTTHRIIGTEMSEGKEYFVTKGDANEERDANLVSVRDILGKVMVDVPYLGFVLDFARQPAGFALLIGLPALLIIIDELDNIGREVRRVRKMKITKEMIMPLVIAPYQPNPLNLATLNMPTVAVKKPLVTAQVRMMDIKPKVQKVENPALQLKNKSPMFAANHDIKSRFVVATAGFVMIITLLGQTGVGYSLAYPADVEASVDNHLKAQALDFTISPELASFSILDGEFSGEDGVEVNINDGENNFNYAVSMNFASGTVALCDDILVSADSPLSFSGSLSSLTGNNVAFLNPWSLNFSLAEASEYNSGDTCTINLIMEGYAGNSEDQGYVDAETIVLTFVANKTLIPAPQADFTNLVTKSEPLEDSGKSVEQVETVIEDNSAPAPETIDEPVGNEVDDTENESVESDGVEEAENQLETTTEEESDNENQPETEPEV
ncbi:MAG: signal peptidase I [Candidatus Pacebacteria bacterium]|nr:signal peptidase I [Candidatus Paceibacterota bacterium]